MRNRAINALIEMGMSASLKGFYYIADAMELYHERKNDYMNMTATYNQIAEKYGITWRCVEHSIRNAFNTLIKKGNRTAVEKYLSYDNTTNKNLLRLFHLRLEQEVEE
jgi:hypothetical protein